MRRFFMGSGSGGSSGGGSSVSSSTGAGASDAIFDQVADGRVLVDDVVARRLVDERAMDPTSVPPAELAVQLKVLGQVFLDSGVYVQPHADVLASWIQACMEAGWFPDVIKYGCVALGNMTNEQDRLQEEPFMLTAIVFLIDKVLLKHVKRWPEVEEHVYYALDRMIGKNRRNTNKAMKTYKLHERACEAMAQQLDLHSKHKPVSLNLLTHACAIAHRCSWIEGVEKDLMKNQGLHELVVYILRNFHDAPELERRCCAIIGNLAYEQSNEMILTGEPYYAHRLVMEAMKRHPDNARLLTHASVTFYNLSCQNSAADRIHAEGENDPEWDPAVLICRGILAHSTDKEVLEKGGECLLRFLYKTSPKRVAITMINMGLVNLFLNVSTDTTLPVGVCETAFSVLDVVARKAPSESVQAPLLLHLTIIRKLTEIYSSRSSPNPSASRSLARCQGLLSVLFKLMEALHDQPLYADTVVEPLLAPEIMRVLVGFCRHLPINERSNQRALLYCNYHSLGIISRCLEFKQRISPERWAVYVAPPVALHKHTIGAMRRWTAVHEVQTISVAILRTVIEASPTGCLDVFTAPPISLVPVVMAALRGNRGTDYTLSNLYGFVQLLIEHTSEQRRVDVVHELVAPPSSLLVIMCDYLGERRPKRIDCSTSMDLLELLSSLVVKENFPARLTSAIHISDVARQLTVIHNAFLTRGDTPNFALGRLLEPSTSSPSDNYAFVNKIARAWSTPHIASTRYADDLDFDDDDDDDDDDLDVDL